MLQRVQSILLFITSLAMATFLATNSFVKTFGSNEKIIVNAFHFLHTRGSLVLIDKPIYYIATAGALSFILTIFTIFQYKNRIRQMLLVALNSLLIGITLAATVYHIQNDAIKISGSGQESGYYIGIYAAFIALACNWLANRFIRKDEKLVKDADRMR